MKKQIMTIGTAIVFTFGSLTFIGCGDCQAPQDNAEQTEHHDDANQKHYQCPMDCEGGKTYHEAGTCPVCKMDLKELDDE